MSSTSVVALIQVRLESQRLPRKALADLDGRSMIERIIDRLKSASLLDQIAICTADTPANKALAAIAADNEIGFFMGAEDDVLRRFAGAAEYFDAGHLVRVTGDNPLVDPAILDCLIDAHRDTDAMFSKAVDVPLGIGTEIMSRKLVEEMLSEFGPGEDTQHLLYFMFNPERHACTVLEPPEKYRYPLHVVTVDTQQELERARSLFAAFRENPLGPDFVALVDYLIAEDPQVVMQMDQELDLPKGRRGTFSQYCDWIAQAKAMSTLRSFDVSDLASGP